jgi:anti-anti-sigma regulatory factor
MRVSGTVELEKGYGPHDHLCLVYHDGTQFLDTARRFLDDGRAQGLQVRYISRTAVLGSQPETDDRRDASAALGGVPPLGVPVEPAAQVRAYVAATAEALAAGYTGLRVVAEATPLVATPEQRSAFARFEHLVDRYMTANPFSALCAYDRTRLEADAVAEVACMHPASSPGASPFRLHAAPAVAAAVAGEVDRFSEQLFAEALDRAALPVVDGEIVIDASRLDFVDHRGILVLAALARRERATVVLRTNRTMPRKLVRLLGIDDVRVEPPG